MTDNYTMKTTPFAHQLSEWERTRELENWAHFWEQGTGKSKLTIDSAAWRFKAGLINAVVVVAPGGVHTNWVKDELPTHMPDDVNWRAFAWHASRAGTKAHERGFAEILAFPGLAVLAITYEAAAITDKGKKALWDFLRKRKCMFVLDESARIKTPSAKRTQTLIKASRYAQSRRLLTGTPVANSPFDVYSQMRFLDPDFWKVSLGIGSFSAFQHEFGVIVRCQNGSGQQFDQVVDYRNLDRLHDAIQPLSSRVLKEDVLDLPPKLYQMRYYELTPEQRRVYESLKSECLAWLSSGELVTATLVMTRMLRFQQICCGYIVTDDGEVKEIPGANPRLELLRDVASDTPRGDAHIIWARFQRDIDLITDALKKDGRRFAQYDGRTPPDERDRARHMFQGGDIEFFVANPAAAGEGLTLTRSKRTTYYNNSYRLTERLQSEDRNHRIGQKWSVLYDDLVCAGTIDEHAVRALRSKMDVASAVTGDRLKEWLI